MSVHSRQVEVYTATIAPPALLKDSSKIVEYNIGGVMVGDAVIVTPPMLLPDTQPFIALVSGPGKVSICWINTTSKINNPAAGVYTFTCIRG